AEAKLVKQSAWIPSETAQPVWQPADAAASWLMVGPKSPAARTATLDTLVPRFRLLVDLGRFGPALDVASDALRQQPGHLDLRRQRGDVHSAMGNLEAAIDDYGYVLSREPANTEVLVRLGDVYARSGQIDAARVQYERAIDCDAANRYGQRGKAARTCFR